MSGEKETTHKQTVSATAWHGSHAATQCEIGYPILFYFFIVGIHIEEAQIKYKDMDTEDFKTYA